MKITRHNKAGIEQARLDRDKDRVSLSDDFYDYIINNNETIEAFRTKLYLTGSIINSQIQ